MECFLAIVPLLLYAVISQAAPMVNQPSEDKAPNSPSPPPHIQTEAAVPSVPPSPPQQRQPHQYDDEDDEDNEPPSQPSHQPNEYAYPPPSQPQFHPTQQNVSPPQPRRNPSPQQDVQPPQIPQSKHHPSSQSNSKPPQPYRHPSPPPPSPPPPQYNGQPPQPQPNPPSGYNRQPPQQPPNPYLQHDPLQQYPPCPPGCQPANPTPPPEQPPKQTGCTHGILNLIKVLGQTAYESLVGENGILTNLVYTSPKKSKPSGGGAEIPSGCCIFVRNTPSDPKNDENGLTPIALPPINCYFIRNRSGTTTPGTKVGASLVPGASTNTKSDQVNCCCVGKHILSFRKIFKWIFKPQFNCCAIPINITGAE